jgi:hypothetical protein
VGVRLDTLRGHLSGASYVVALGADWRW